MIFTCILIGLVVGIASSFLAIGGGVLMVPALITFLYVPRHQAIATSLTIIFLLSLTNTFFFARKKLINFKVGVSLGLFAALAAFVSGQFGTRASSDELAYGFLVFLAIVAIQSFRGDKTKTAKFLAENKRFRPFIVPVLGIITGVASAFSGAGGGVIMAPYIDASKLVKPSQVVPTVTMAMVMISLAASSSYVLASSSINFVKFDAALLIFAAAAVSSTLGQKYQHRLSPRTRGWLLGTILLALIAQTLIQIFSK